MPTHILRFVFVMMLSIMSHNVVNNVGSVKTCDVICVSLQLHCSGTLSMELLTGVAMQPPTFINIIFFSPEDDTI